MNFPHLNEKHIPVDYLAHKDTDAALRRYFNVSNEHELLNLLGADFFYLPGRDISQNEGILPCYRGKPLEMSKTERTCPLQICWRRGAYDSKFTVDEAISGPLQRAEISEKEILSFPWPRASDFDFSSLQGSADANSNRIRIGGLWTGVMGDSYRMHGFENFLYNLAANPRVIHTLIDRMTDMYLELNDAYFSALKGRMEIWFFGNDFGSQESMLLSRDMWEEYFFANIKRLCALAHSYGIKVMMHSCGAIAPLIPLLIKAGVDILDPIQITAKGMSAAELAAQFKGQITFHGGIDTQNILPLGTRYAVQKHVRETVSVLAPDINPKKNTDGPQAGICGSTAGYIFAPSQILGPDIPLENIHAMYDTIHEINAAR